MNFRAGDVITVSQQGSDWLLIYDVVNVAVRGMDKSTSISWKVPDNASLKLWAGDKHAADGGATLTRLTSGLLQLSRPDASGKVYSYTFAGCGK